MPEVLQFIKISLLSYKQYSGLVNPVTSIIFAVKVAQVLLLISTVLPKERVGGVTEKQRLIIVSAQISEA